MHYEKDVGTGLCQYVELCFHASSLPCLHTFWHAIPTSFYIFKVYYFLAYQQSQPVEDNSDMKSDVALQEVDS